MKRAFLKLTKITALASVPVAIFFYAGLISTVAITPGCGSDSSEEKECDLEWADATLKDKTVCAIGKFSEGSENITNPFFLLTEGNMWVLEGEEDGEDIRIESTVGGTTTVAGVTVRIVNEKEYEDGVLIEDTDDWYAQAEDGTVCYLGEDVTNIEEDGSTNSEGTWTADFETNFPGIIMPADPQVGDIYLQERAPGIAEDMSEVVALGEEITVPFGTYTDTMTGNDCNPQDREPEDKKVYASGVGLVFDNGVELISATIN